MGYAEFWDKGIDKYAEGEPKYYKHLVYSLVPQYDFKLNDQVQVSLALHRLNLLAHHHTNETSRKS